MNSSGLRILHIEDDKNDAALIAALLKDFTTGMVLKRTDRLASGLKLIEKDQFDIVLLDLSLPDSAGLNALQKIHAKNALLPIIIMTGLADEDTASDAIILGAQDYLIKGEFDRKLLQRCIRYAVQRKQTQDALERAHKELEVRVLEQTSELSITNTELTAQMAQQLMAEDELTKSHEQMRELATHLQSIREEERTNIAREIHDELGQVLTALKMDLFWVKNRLSAKQQPVLDKLHSDIELIDNTISSVKRICTELRPAILDNLGLEAALEWQCEEFMKRTGIGCRISSKVDIPVTDMKLKTAIFRIFQEILTNILRHSGATAVNSLLMASAKAIILEVRDNGIGIAQENLSKARSFGLLGMRERVFPWGGRIEIKSAKNAGTTVSAIIPVSEMSVKEH